MRILVTCIGLACAAIVLMISYAEKQQEIALDMLSSYKLKPQPVLYDDPDHELVTARAVPACEMSDEQAGGLNEARSDYR